MLIMKFELYNIEVKYRLSEWDIRIVPMRVITSFAGEFELHRLNSFFIYR